MSLSARILGSLIFIVTLFSLTILIGGTAQISDYLSKQQKQTLTDNVINSVKENTFLFYQGNNLNIQEWFDSIGRANNVRYAAITDKENNIKLHTSADGLSLSANTIEHVQENIGGGVDEVNFQLSFDSEINDDYHSIYLYINDNRSTVWKEIGGLLLILVIGAVFIIVPILFLVAQWIKRPFMKLKDQLLDIDPRANEFQTLYLPNSTPDEITVVSNTVNDLLVQIFNHTSNLDNEVAAKTQMLSDALVLAKTSASQKQNLIANITHDLKTPLSSIACYLELILERLEFDDKKLAHEYSNKALKVAQEMASEIQEVLQVSTSSEIGIEGLSKFSALDVVQELVEKHEVLTQKNNNEITVIIATDHPVLSYRSTYSHVLDNLLSNANKFCEKGTISILVNFYADDKIIETIVSDNGIKMEPSMISQILEGNLPSIRHEESRSGKGLKICKNLLETIGGSIELRPNDPVGVEATFKVPYLDK